MKKILFVILMAACLAVAGCSYVDGMGNECACGPFDSPLINYSGPCEMDGREFVRCSVRLCPETVQGFVDRDIAEED